jgi:hypothetical protein
MNTGLTYLTIYDYTLSAAPDGGNAIVIFSDYDEALSYAIWNAKYIGDVFGTNRLVYTIYTTGPNSNGYVLAASSPVFISFD